MKRNGSAVIVLLIVILIILAVGLVWYYTNKGAIPNQQLSATATATSSAPSQPTTFHNILLGYSITIPAGWRVAEQYSQEYFSDVHPTSTFTGPENSDVIILTDLNASQESSYLAQNANYRHTISETHILPVDDTIQITPSSFKPNLNSTSTSRLNPKKLTLPNQLQVGFVDTLPQLSLTAWIMHISSYFVVPENATMQSLSISTWASPSSSAESAFYSILYSIQF
jgi:hypothetical protein